MAFSQTEKLFHLTKSISSKNELKEMIEVLVAFMACEIPGADLVGFFIKEASGKFRGYVGNKNHIPFSNIYIDPERDLFAKSILSKGGAEYIPDAKLDSRLDPHKLNLMQIKSIFGIPLYIEDDPFGLLFIHYKSININLTEEQIYETESLVNMACIAIQNKLLVTEQRNLLQRKELLMYINRALSQSHNKQEVAQTCFQYLQKIINLHDMAIFLYNENEQCLIPFGISSNSRIDEDVWKEFHENEGKIYLEEDPLFKEALQSKKSIAITDVASDARATSEMLELYQNKSILLIPMEAKGKVFGIIKIASIDDYKEFRKNDIKLCKYISDATAVALSNALYAEQQENLVKERTFELQQSYFKLEQLVEELKHTNEIKNDFISSLSHELRTPVTAIKGTFDLLQMGVTGELTDIQRQLIETSQKAVTRLLNQINELLDFSKLANGNIQLVIEKNRVQEIVKEALSIVDPLIVKKEHKIIFNSYTDIMIDMDRERVLQVLINLLSNAIKFTPNNGTILVSYYQEDQNIVIEVQDNGIGIPEEKKPFIFTRFYQANNNGIGTGLGLAISKHLINIHGGTLSFDSREGEGSTFRIVLPVKQESHEYIEMPTY